MKLSRLALLIPLAFSPECASPTSAGDKAVAFTHTVSFGFCPETAFCTSRLDLDDSNAVMTFESRRRGSVVRRRAVDAALWRSVADSLDRDRLLALPKVIGCPDCADGGAESLTVIFDDARAASVTFEYGAQVPGIEAVVRSLREVRESFGPAPADR